MNAHIRTLLATGTVLAVAACATGERAPATPATAQASPAAASAVASAEIVPVASTAVVQPPDRESVAVAQFRGNAARTGQMTGPAPLEAPTLRWTFEAGGAVRTAQAIGYGYAYVGSDDGTLHAVDLETGEAAWRVDIGGTPTSPAIAGSSVVVGSSSGHLLALDARTGSPTWDVDLEAPVRGAPAVADAGLVVAASDGTVVLLDPSNGHRRWTAHLDGRVTRSPAVSDGRIVVPLDPGQLAALDLRTGRSAWLTRIASSGAVGSPAADAGIVVTAKGLDGGNPGRDRGLVALDLATGEPLWGYHNHTGDFVYTPALVDGRAFAIGTDGIAVALDTTSGLQIWTRQLGEALEALPAVSSGLLIVAGNGGHLRSLDVRTADERWVARIAGVPYAPTVGEGLVVVPTDTGTVFAFGATQ